MSVHVIITADLSNPFFVHRGWAHWSYCQVWLCWALFQRAIFQKGRLSAAVSAGIWGLVGRTAQWYRWLGATPVYCSPRHVSVFIHTHTRAHACTVYSSSSRVEWIICVKADDMSDASWEYLNEQSIDSSCVFFSVVLFLRILRVFFAFIGQLTVKI